MNDLSPFLHLMTDAEWLLLDAADGPALPMVAVSPGRGGGNRNDGGSGRCAV